MPVTYESKPIGVYLNQITWALILYIIAPGSQHDINVRIK